MGDMKKYQGVILLSMPVMTKKVTSMQMAYEL